MTTTSKATEAAANAAPRAPDHTFLLTRFEGEKPAAPAWFERAIAAPKVDGTVTVDGAEIAWRRWGEPGRPGLMFVHGGVAHLGWWDFIAPFFADRYCVAAVSLSGMGDSDHRETYLMPTYAREARAAAEAAGLTEHADQPVLVGHSFGGFVALTAARVEGAFWRGAVVVDSPIRERREEDRPTPRRRGARVYADDTAALARFRLLPDQDCEHLFLVDHIAREALTPARDEDGNTGVRWKHDPDLWLKLQTKVLSPAEIVAGLHCPVTLVRGGASALVSDDVWDAMAQAFGTDTPMVTIPEARHHVMLDQPLAFVAALDGVLSVWPTRD